MVSAQKDFPARKGGNKSQVRPALIQVPPPGVVACDYNRVLLADLPDPVLFNLFHMVLPLFPKDIHGFIRG